MQNKFEITNALTSAQKGDLKPLLGYARKVSRQDLGQEQNRKELFFLVGEVFKAKEKAITFEQFEKLIASDLLMLNAVLTTPKLIEVFDFETLLLSKQKGITVRWNGKIGEKLLQIFSPSLLKQMISAEWSPIIFFTANSARLEKFLARYPAPGAIESLTIEVLMAALKHDIQDNEIATKGTSVLCGR